VIFIKIEHTWWQQCYSVLYHCCVSTCVIFVSSEA